MKKQFKVWQATIFTLGIVIGSGAFYSAYLISKETHNAWLTLVVIGIGGFIVIALAQCFKEVNSSFSGNVFMPVWMRGLVGRPLGSYLAINLAMITSPFSATFMGYLFGQFLIPVFFSTDSSFIINTHGVDIINTTGHTTFIALCGIISVGSFSLIHIFSFHFGKWFQIIGTIVKLIPLFGVIIFGIIVSNRTGFWNHPFKFDDSITNIGIGTWLKAILLGTVASFFIFDGFYYAIRLGKNIENSERNVGRVMIFSTLAVIVIFVLFIYAALQISVGGTIKFNQPWLNKTMYLLFALSSLVALNANSYTGTRIFQTLQNHKLLPKFIDFEKENKNNMPTRSAIAMLIMNLTWSVGLMSIFLISKNDFFSDLITGMTCSFYLWFGVIALFTYVNRFTKKAQPTVRVKGLVFWALFSFSMCFLLTGYKIYSLYNVDVSADGKYHRIAFWTLILSTIIITTIWLFVEFFWKRYRQNKTINNNPVVKTALKIK